LHEKHVFKALDAAVAMMEKLKFTNSYDGRILGGLATVMFQNEKKAIGYLRSRKVPALDKPDEREELWQLAGPLIAEDYLKARKDRIPTETRLTSARELLASVTSCSRRWRLQARRWAQEDVLASEMAITFAELEDPTNIALALIDDAIGTYESLVPKTRHDEVPKAVERHSIAKAAFLRLAVEDLEAQVQEEGIEGDLRAATSKPRRHRFSSSAT
jgi:hypothetical protein